MSSACPALSAFCSTVAVICSILAAISSKLLACPVVDSLKLILLLDIALERMLISLPALLILVTVSLNLLKVAVKDVYN